MIGAITLPDTQTTRLIPHHFEHLCRSVLSRETKETLGFYSGSASEIKAVLGLNAGRRLIIPYPDTQPESYRVKRDAPFGGQMSGQEIPIPNRFYKPRLYSLSFTRRHLRIPTTNSSSPKVKKAAEGLRGGISLFCRSNKKG